MSPFVSSAVEKHLLPQVFLDFARNERVRAVVAFWCYLLRCADGRYYTGHTDDLDRRIAQHQHGGFCDYTSRRRPVALVWSQEFPTRLEALDAERRVGGWSRAKKEALIAGDWKALGRYAKPPSERKDFATAFETDRDEPAGLTKPFVSSAVEKRSTGDGA